MKRLPEMLCSDCVSVSCLDYESTIDFYKNALFMTQDKSVDIGSKVFLSFRYHDNDIALQFMFDRVSF